MKTYIKRALEEGYHITTAYLLTAEHLNTRLMEATEILEEDKLVIPGKWYNRLIKDGTIESPFERHLTIDGLPDGAIEVECKHKDTIVDALAERGWNVDVVSCNWDRY